MFLNQVSQAELILVMNSLNKFSSGFDDIPDYIIKCTSYYILEPLRHIINYSFSTGAFPDLLKVAVTPLPKKGAIDDKQLQTCSAA